ncbi:MAG: hypothetical protein M3044_12830 [Thermoproteota archaeon]|nr:hypothetical protein [Thermoproteota archaeon]
MRDTLPSKPCKFCGVVIRYSDDLRVWLNSDGTRHKDVRASIDIEEINKSIDNISRQILDIQSSLAIMKKQIWENNQLLLGKLDVINRKLA